MASFDLCPKCGAVSRDGVCSSCGYKVPVANSEQQKEVNQGNPYNQVFSYGEGNGGFYQPDNNYQTVPITNGKSGFGAEKVGYILGAVFVLLIFSAVLGAVYGYSKDIMRSAAVSETEKVFDFDYTSPETTSDYDYSTYEEEELIDTYGYYDGHLKDVLAKEEESLITGEWKKLSKDPYEGKDPEAYEFDTYIDDKVSYSVWENNWMFSNPYGEYDDLANAFVLPHYLNVGGNYFRLQDTGLEHEEEINRLIFERALDACAMGELGVYYITLGSGNVVNIYNTAYVSYMDDKVISIAFSASATLTYSESDEEVSFLASISSINIDLATGREILAGESFDFGNGFYEKFKTRCLEQNGSPIDFYTDEELEAVLTDDDQVFWVYTPLGLEVGVNREYYAGWATGTFTDYSKFYKIY